MKQYGMYTDTQESGKGEKRCVYLGFGLAKNRKSKQRLQRLAEIVTS